MAVRGVVRGEERIRGEAAASVWADGAAPREVWSAVPRESKAVSREVGVEAASVTLGGARESIVVRRDAREAMAQTVRKAERAVPVAWAVSAQRVLEFLAKALAPGGACESAARPVQGVRAVPAVGAVRVPRGSPAGMRKREPALWSAPAARKAPLDKVEAEEASAAVQDAREVMARAGGAAETAVRKTGAAWPAEVWAARQVLAPGGPWMEGPQAVLKAGQVMAVRMAPGGPREPAARSDRRWSPPRRGARPPGISGGRARSL
jgi:hypothetical protein